MYANTSPTIDISVIVSRFGTLDIFHMKRFIAQG